MARLYSIADAKKGAAAETPKNRGVKGGAPRGRMAAQREVAGRIAGLYNSRRKDARKG